MKYSTLIVCALSTLILGSLPTSFAAYSEEDVPAVVQHMRDVNKNFRTLRRQLDDTAQKEANLKLIAQIRSALILARQEEPLKTPELEASDRGPFLEDYRQLLEDVITEMDKLKGAVEAGNIPEAKNHLKQINEMKNQGHEKFQKED